MKLFTKKSQKNTEINHTRLYNLALCEYFLNKGDKYLEILSNLVISNESNHSINRNLLVSILLLLFEFYSKDSKDSVKANEVAQILKKQLEIEDQKDKPIESLVTVIFIHFFIST